MELLVQTIASPEPWIDPWAQRELFAQIHTDEEEEEEGEEELEEPQDDAAQQRQTLPQ